MEFVFRKCAYMEYVVRKYTFMDVEFPLPLPHFPPSLPSTNDWFCICAFIEGGFHKCTFMEFGFGTCKYMEADFHKFTFTNDTFRTCTFTKDGRFRKCPFNV